MTRGGTYRGANLSCGEDGCDGNVTVTVPGDSPIIVTCTKCGEGNRYEQFKNGTKIRGGVV